MGILNKSRVYLAGPIECAADEGVGWRTRLTPQLESLGIRVLDPTNKQLVGNEVPNEIGDELELMKSFRANGDIDSLIKYYSKIRAIDLRMTDLADFMIVYLPYKNIHMCGTWEELYNMNRQKKPILIMFEGEVSSDMAGWMFGVMKHNIKDWVFNDWDKLFEYLQAINSGEVELNTRWCLLDPKLGENADLLAAR